MTIDSPFPNMSPLEAVRAVLAIVGFVAAFYGLAHTTDGMAAFASPIRERMVHRRRWQMSGALVMFSAMGAQTGLAAETPDVYPLSLPTLTVNLALIVTLGVLLFLTLQQALGWVAFEEILGKTPLIPTPDAYVAETSLVGRRLIHEMNGELQMLVGELELLAADPSLARAQRASLVRVSEHVDTVRRGVIDVQQLIRSLSPETSGAPV
jgi:hypothetical protein